VKEPIVADTKQDPPTVAEAVTEELADQILAQQKEYSQYVAKDKIFAPNGALAYNKGDAVPASNVSKLKYDELGWVVKTGSKEHAAIIAELG
jgi:hypothetical protein